MNKISIRKFIRNYENGKYNDSLFDTMVNAGWYDWFCEGEELKQRLDTLFPKVKQLATSQKINIDTMYVFFKNNCPMKGDLYDDFRFCERRTGDVVYTIIPASGHERDKGLAEVWGRENNFERALAKGYWHDIQEFFEIEKISEGRSVQ